MERHKGKESMDRTEFLNILGKRLAQTFSAEQVREQVDYYDAYIREQMASGKTEQEVLEELGDPLLIARTIMDTAQEVEGGNGSMPKEENPEETHQREPWNGWILMNSRTGCLITGVIFLIILLLMVWLIGSLLAAALPVLIPVLLVIWLAAALKHKK